MRPTDYPLDLARLQAAWEAFAAQGVVSAETFPPLDPLILDSWRRSQNRANPRQTPAPARLSEHTLDALLERHAVWLASALPYAEDIYQYSIRSNCAVLITDRSGCLLSVLGDARVLSLVQQLNLGPGAFWSEEQLGTSAVGLALIAAMPTQVVGAEHFFQSHHRFVTTAAPFHDADGALLGVIGLAALAETASSRDIALVMAAARAISNQFQGDAVLEESNIQLTQLRAIVEAADDGMLMWDSQGRIQHCNALAARMLGLPRQAIVGANIAGLVDWSPDVQRALADGRPIQRVDTLIIANRRRIGCLLTLQPFHTEHAAVHHVAFLKPIAQVRRLVSEQVGMTAGFGLHDLSSQTPGMQAVLQQAGTLARGSLPILLSGETGVGKTFLAQAIHNASPRANRPFLTVNCRAVLRPLMRTELFGVAGGDGRASRPSKFELADGGTILINQIQYLAPDLQLLLLDVINRRHLQRVGGSRAIPVNVRIIATLPHTSEQLASERPLLPELHYQLHACHLTLPPLRERSADIIPLAAYFLRQFNQGSDVALEANTAALLTSYGWPGNIRELETVLEHAFAVSDGHVIRPGDLPVSVRRSHPTVAPSPAALISLKEAEREAIIRAGRLCNGVLSKMAQELGIGRTTLWRKMRAYNLTPDQFKF